MRPEELVGKVKEALEGTAAGEMETHMEHLKGHHLPTYEHSIRVGYLAYHVSTLCLPQISPYAVAGAAFLHDIGKTRLPAHLLSKAEITPVEYEMIKAHARKGYEMLKEKLPFHACIAGKHHFAYPVEGYPEGLPLHERMVSDYAVRIVSVCDWTDAAMARDNSFSRALWKGRKRTIASLEDTLSSAFPKDPGLVSLVVDPYLMNAIYKVEI